MTEQAEVTQRSRISPIWLLPIITVLIGVWMFGQHIHNKGTDITIVMPNAEGITVGKTEIRVKSVKIGVIDKLKLGDDQTYVIAKATIEKEYADLLRQDSLIWAVKPRIAFSGVSGINTLLSGIYFEFQPGTKDELSYSYRLLDSPPPIDKDIRGGRYQLVSSDAEVLEVGAPVLFKGYQVGQIETAKFDWQQQQMQYQIFVHQPYNNLVTSNSLFWIASGVEFDLNAEGVSFRAQSMSSILQGGIAFAPPENQPPGDIVKSGHQFVLNPDFKTSLEKRFVLTHNYLINFDQSIRGLTVGAPVEYRGIRIGTVLQAPATNVSDGTPLYFGSGQTSVPVLISIEYGRIHEDEQQAKAFWEQNIAQWIEQGLRASLKPGNLLTGSMYIDIDIHDNAKPATIAQLDGYQVFPSVYSGFDLITNQISQVLDKINNLDIEKSLASVNQTLASFEKLADHLSVFMGNQDLQQLPAELNTSLKQLSETLESFQDGSPVYQDIQATLRAFDKVANDLQPLVKSLNEHPNILVFDKQPTEDIQPKAKNKDD